MANALTDTFIVSSLQWTKTRKFQIESCNKLLLEWIWELSQLAAFLTDVLTKAYNIENEFV